MNQPLPSDSPSDRLRALLEISTNLSKTLALDPLLTQIADTLFELFEQADPNAAIRSGGDTYWSGGHLLSCGGGATSGGFEAFTFALASSGGNRGSSRRGE